MRKHLIGISAALSLLIFAASAQAAPPSPLSRVHQAARFDAAQVARQPVPKVKPSVMFDVKARRAPIERPGGERINYADVFTRLPTDRARTTTRSVFSPTQQRLMSAEERNDPIAVERQRQRNHKRAAMARAKCIAAKFKGL